MPKISVISPSIRPQGLQTTFRTLQAQTFKDFEWLPMLSAPGEKPDLCRQMNAALKLATGEIIVFLQDHIEIDPEALQGIWALYEMNPTVCFTFPVGKKDGDEVKWDWRPYWCNENTPKIEPQRFEIDFAMAPRVFMLPFDERYDSGFGWENVEVAYRMAKQGTQFAVEDCIRGVAFDHDKAEPHPYKHKPNQDLWIVDKGVLDLD